MGGSFLAARNVAKAWILLVVVCGALALAGWEEGEEFDAMRDRVVEALIEIGISHEGGWVLVVTHGGPVVAAWLAAGGAFEDRPVVSNCHVLPMRVEGWRITRVD